MEAQNTIQENFTSNLEAQEFNNHDSLNIGYNLDDLPINFASNLEAQESNNHDSLNMDYNLDGLPLNLTSNLETQQEYHSKEYPLDLNIPMGGSSVGLHTIGLNNEDLSSYNLYGSGNQSSTFPDNYSISNENEDHSVNLIGISGGGIGLSVHDIKTFNEDTSISTKEKGPSIGDTSISGEIGNRSDTLEISSNYLDFSNEDLIMPNIPVDFSNKDVTMSEPGIEHENILSEYLQDGNLNFNSQNLNHLGVNSYSMGLPLYNISTPNDGSNFNYPSYSQNMISNVYQDISLADPSSSQGMISNIHQDIPLNYPSYYSEDFTHMNYNNTPLNFEETITKDDIISFSNIKDKIIKLIELKVIGRNKKLSNLKFQDKILEKYFFNVALKKIYVHNKRTSNINVDTLLISLKGDRFNHISPDDTLNNMELIAKNNILDKLDIDENSCFHFINIKNKILNLLQCNYVLEKDSIKELQYQSKDIKTIFFKWGRLVTEEYSVEAVLIENIIQKLNVRTNLNNLEYYQTKDANDLDSLKINTILNSDVQLITINYNNIKNKIQSLLNRSLVEMDDNISCLPYESSKTRQCFFDKLNNENWVKDNSLRVKDLEVNHLLALPTPS